MENGSITSKDIIGWIVAIVISLVPSLIKIKQVENMLYKEIIARKDLEIKMLKRENKELKKKLEEKEERKS
ncbi:hypothetical protein [endosymbiont GvMRE of Glomus versiforme]|uniref:hypothetical protein n=1 Tax=endosymbiont GvMRE of Glomus versiforme TaxID=2039283 RepID=UPI0011C3EEFD|nr:hypothetical protein [endosymbiont GvMRE of Glomus versiforme]